MYKTLDGRPLEFSYGDKGEKVQYGSDKWNGELTEAERKQLKENFLRGYDTDGSVNPDQNKEWIIKKYSAFMGQVTTDAFNAKRQQHFEQKGRFFDNGVDEQNVYTSKAVALANKNVSYNNTLTDIAFPQRLLSAENLEEQLDDDGAIAKAFETEFKDYDVSFDFDDGVVEIDDEEFDFTGENKASELERMKRYLAKLTPPDELIVNGLSNSVDGDDWSKLRDKQYEYHRYVNPPTFDPSASLPRDDEGNIITQ
jgi:hypothetical protein